MDSSMASNAEDPIEKFLHIPYEQRWDYLKEIIIRIYMEEQSKIAALAKRMKETYSFDAKPHQYRYHFKKWDIKKRITTEEKGAIISALGKRRLREGVSTSDAVLDQGGVEKVVDKKQLKRHINQSIRQSESLTWTPGLFLQNSLPYAALFPGHASQHPSPSGVTPSYLTVNSPQASGSPSTSHNAMTPTMQLVQKKVLLDRAKLLIEGRVQDLIVHMTSEERESTITWLHDFWMYSFMTAKYWGRGPKIWTPSLINFKSFATNGVPPMPGHQIEQSYESVSHSPSGQSTPISSPTQLCRWSIHHDDEVDYEPIDSPPQSQEGSEDQYDIDDESTWAQWSHESPSLSATITQGLRDNGFTAVQNETLPIAADIITKTIEKSEEELQIEALGFAIVSGNFDLIYEILEYWEPTLSVSAISPFHLAAQYLRGAQSCCLIMDSLVIRLKDKNSIGVNYIDSSGHTVLDMLFVTILKSHSTVPPHLLSEAFIGQSRYRGQEVDPCGRWDADSPCVRQLYASGKQTIPHRWKHVFCHTSVQAICHCITAIFGVTQRPNIDTPSGLFSSRCPRCGLKLTLGPLHALILVAFYLAEFGCPGETLFGVVACLVCLLVYRADPCATAKVSISAVLGLDTANDDCQHSQINALELALGVPLEKMNSWTPDVRQGWNTFIAILENVIESRRSKQMVSKRQTTMAARSVFGAVIPHTNSVEDDDSDSGDDHYIHDREAESGQKLVYCENRQLGIIWTVIQAELLTYRRLAEHDTWLSLRFHMEDIINGLKENDDAYLGRLVSGTKDKEGYALKDHSRCGLFLWTDDSGGAKREEVCKSYYANLEDWKRTTFIRARES